MTKNDYLRAVDRNSRRVYLIALSFTRSHEDAEDVMQSVFMKLWDKGGQFENDEHVDKWLTVVCVNECKNLIRRPFRRRETPLDELCGNYSFDKGRDLDLFRAVMSLPEKERVAVHLFYYEDMSVARISETLGISEAAVKTRLHRARTALKNTLGEDWINE